MSMELRFKRAFEILDKESKEWDYKTYNRILFDDALDLRWLRNASCLWEDYVEDDFWIINGVNHDPNHPENLSFQIYEVWKNTKCCHRI